MRRKIIFDLDRTLWKCTVEYHPRLHLPPVYNETKDVLLHLQNLGYSLNIASRSAEPDKCNEFLDNLFPQIVFAKRAIYPSPVGKLNHILDLGCQDGNFIMFDDEAHILEKVKKVYPLSTRVICTHPILWSSLQGVIVH